MTYTIGTAAKATGKAKSTISRDVKDGKISAAKNEDGSYTIDPAELHRVYPPVSENGSSNSEENDPQPQDYSFGTGELQAELHRLRERLTSSARALELTEAERERERRQLQSEIEYLRDTLKNEGEERRKLTAILTGPSIPAVTDQQPSSEVPKSIQEKAVQMAEKLTPSGLWSRLAGRIIRTG